MTEEPILVELSDGSIVKVDNESWRCTKSYLAIEWTTNEDLVKSTGPQFSNPPVSVHIPDETKSARTNELGETEISARIIADIKRYAKVGRSPSYREAHPHSEAIKIGLEDIPLPYLKIHPQIPS